MEVRFWRFEGNNLYNCEKYTYEQAVEAFKSLKNCKNCVNCENCENCECCTCCKNCENCFGCYECYNQRELTRKFHKGGENDE